jgi:hypothetical protein
MGNKTHYFRGVPLVFVPYLFERKEEMKNGAISYRQVNYWLENALPGVDCGEEIDCIWFLENEKYTARQVPASEYVLIEKSIYYTRTGQAELHRYEPDGIKVYRYLSVPQKDGEKTLCFGHEMFGPAGAPYPVCRVDNDEEVTA